MSHINIIDGGLQETVYAGQTAALCSWSTADKTLVEGLCYFTVSSFNPVFALSMGAETTGLQDAYATITWSCKQKGKATVVVDLRPDFTFCVSADTVSIAITLGPLQALPFWPGATKIDVAVCGSFGHGYRKNRLMRTAMGGLANPGVIQLDRPNFATHAFARVSTGNAIASQLSLFGGSIGGFAGATYTQDVAGGAANAPQFTGELPLASQDTNAVLALANPLGQTGVVGYVIQF